MDLYPYFDITTGAERVMTSSMDRINKSDPASPRDAVVDPNRQRKDQGSGGREKDENNAGENFESLQGAAEEANRELESKNSRYRFYIYREEGQVYINLVRLDDAGNIAEVKHKNITDREFNDLIRRFHESEGLFFDGRG